jgi:hypothetical protein
MQQQQQADDMYTASSMPRKLKCRVVRIAAYFAAAAGCVEVGIIPMMMP